MRTRTLLAAVMTMALAACGAGSDDASVTVTEPVEDVVESTTTTGAVETTTTTLPETTTVPETTTTSPSGIAVTVTEGSVEVDGELAVAAGEEVTLTVTSDVSDHVHVHGYDLMAEVGPDSPAEISFVADVPGIFEVELEDRGLLLLQLEVGG